MKQNLVVRCETDRTPLMERTLAILARSMGERGRVAVSDGESGPADLTLAIGPGIGAEGFRIEAQPVGWRITGAEGRGLLYGVGRFLRGCRFGAPGWEYDGWAGESVPRRPVRGMYFATHFHNFYHDAPLEAVERYVEDLALWGCNALSVWFDMHHYTGIDDPAARAMIERLHAVLKAANRVGMGAGLTTLANEAYSTSPAELRAEPFPHHYHVEICPSRPGGLDLILQWRREMIAAFADLDIEYFWIWPYDQGGCKCAECAPWGGNGFVRNAEAVARLVREMLPRARTVVSTWEFGYWGGDAEWERFYAAAAGRPDWIDYIMAEGHGDFPPYILKNGPPPGYPLLNFPEISMSGMGPWGGFGANVQPARLQKVWTTCRDMLAGGFPYSEGIYEDLNKAICLQLGWSPERPVEEIVREYAAAEFGPAVAADVCRAVYRLEEQMSHGTAADADLRAWVQAADPASPEARRALYRLDKVTDPTPALGLLSQAERRMTDAARTGWRWRMLWLRAALDCELYASGGRPTDRSDRFFDEVSAISRAADAQFWVSTPSRAVIRRHFG